MRMRFFLVPGCVVLLGALSPASLTAQEPGAIESRELGSALEITERNKAVVRDFHARLDQGDLDGALGTFADEVENHGRRANKQILRLILEDIKSTFPDAKNEILEMVAEGDIVVARTKVSGTHKGTGKLPVNGGLLVGVPPTGKHYEIQHIHWFKLRDGKIVAHWANRDDIGMMQQLGLLPTPKRAESLNARPAAK